MLFLFYLLNEKRASLSSGFVIAQ